MLSLLLEIEEIVVKFLVQRAKINKPLISTKALSFINSFIKDSDIAPKIIAFYEQQKVFNSSNITLITENIENRYSYPFREVLVVFCMV